METPMILLLLACLSPSTDTDTGGCIDIDDCDGDGWIAEYDCNDLDSSEDASRPTAYYPDGDGDGYGTHDGAEGFCDDPGAGWVLNADDCNDRDPDAGTYPGC